MQLSASSAVLAAKQLEIDELRQLAVRVSLLGAISHLIHVLQAERGASSIFLASSGKQFDETRRQHVQASESIERVVRELLEAESESAVLASSKMFSLMAWVLLGLEELPHLRERIAAHALSGDDALTAFSRLIAGLRSLIFEVADSTLDPVISQRLVALFNLVQGKELAGQERAVGALLFASGEIEPRRRERLRHLCEAQTQHFQLLSEFASTALFERWASYQQSANAQQLEQLRGAVLRSENGKLDERLSALWFEVCSQRISFLWSLQRELVGELQVQCESRIAQAEADLQDTRGLLQRLRELPPSSAERVEHFYSPDIPVEQALVFMPPVYRAPTRAASLLDLLQAQSRQLAEAESALAGARRALDERKLIERAKGVLMLDRGFGEEEAYRQMRELSMDRNLRMVDIARAVLAGARKPSKPAT